VGSVQVDFLNALSHESNLIYRLGNSKGATENIQDNNRGEGDLQLLNGDSYATCVDLTQTHFIPGLSKLLKLFWLFPFSCSVSPFCL
jgi:hypothetical protein